MRILGYNSSNIDVKKFIGSFRDRKCLYRPQEFEMFSCLTDCFQRELTFPEFRRVWHWCLSAHPCWCQNCQVSTIHRSLVQFGEYNFHIHNTLFKIIYTVHKLNSLPTFWNPQHNPALDYVNRQKWLLLGDHYMMEVQVQSRTSVHYIHEP